MDGETATPLRVALVALDAAGLDAFGRALAEAFRAGDSRAPGPVVRLAIAPSAAAPLWRWSALAGVSRAGEIAALGEVVVDAVVVDAASPRLSAVAELGAVLGAAVLALPRVERPA